MERICLESYRWEDKETHSKDGKKAKGRRVVAFKWEYWKLEGASREEMEEASCPSKQYV